MVMHLTHQRVWAVLAEEFPEYFPVLAGYFLTKRELSKKASISPESALHRSTY